MNISFGNSTAELICNSLEELALYFISKGMENDCFHLYRNYCVAALFRRWRRFWENKP